MSDTNIDRLIDEGKFLQACKAMDLVIEQLREENENLKVPKILVRINKMKKEIKELREKNGRLKKHLDQMLGSCDDCQKKAIKENEKLEETIKLSHTLISTFNKRYKNKSMLRTKEVENILLKVLKKK